MPARSARRESSPPAAWARLPSIALSHRRELSNHGVVIGEPDLQARVRVDAVAGLGRPGGRWLHHLEAAHEQVAEPVRRRAGREAEALLELVEDAACLRPDVEVAAEDQWVGSGEGRRPPG